MRRSLPGRGPVSFADESAGAPRKIGYHEAADEPSGPMGFLMGLARSGALERQTDDLHRVLGRPPTSLRQAVASALSQG